MPKFPYKLGLPQIEPGDAITEFGLMKVGDELLLFGHVSGVKTGTFSAILSNIKWPEQPTLTREYAICGDGGESFAKKGDSGAFVLNREGDLVGILVAATEATTGVAYVTPIQAVVDDIHAQTGYDVYLP